jgi:conjugative transfer signal peptidase TraF
MTSNTRTGIGALSAALIVVGTGSLAHSAGLRINTTPSLPMGLWRISSLTGPLAVGDIVTFCPPATAPFEIAHRRHYLASGTCPIGFEPMMKPIAALPGNLVTVSAAGIGVDGRRIPNSGALGRDSEGRPLAAIPSGIYRVGEGEAWLVSSFNPRSYDSRYFGPVATTDFREVAHPILTDNRP